MAHAAGLAVLAKVFEGFVPAGVGLAINAFDKVGFDSDPVGRTRRIAEIEETARIAYRNRGYPAVNIAIWNMHLPERHEMDHDGLLESGTVPMGKGGGFRIVVFTGAGYLENRGARGFENWRCSGNQRLEGNTIRFSRVA